MVVGRPFNISITRRNFFLTRAIWELYSPEFQDKLTTVKTQYGSGGASELIVKKLGSFDDTNLLKKKFNDLRSKLSIDGIIIK